VAVVGPGFGSDFVPLYAHSIDDLRTVIAAFRASGKVYTGMETAVYTNRFLYVQSMRDKSELGAIS